MDVDQQDSYERIEHREPKVVFSYMEKKEHD